MKNYKIITTEDFTQCAGWDKFPEDVQEMVLNIVDYVMVVEDELREGNPNQEETEKMFKGVEEAQSRLIAIREAYL